MSLYEFAACIDGYNKAHSTEETIEAPSAAEFLAAKKLHGDL